jgi:hypothetical protein
MSLRSQVFWPVVLVLFAMAPVLRADVLEMQNGDRYSGKVLAVSADTVVLNSEVLGKINVPRSKVATLTFSTNAAAPKAAVNLPQPVSTNLSIVVTGPTGTNTNADLAAAFRQLGGDTNFVGQIRNQMFAGSPQAAAKYDEMVNGLLNGQINLNDLRQQAQASADQLRQLKREMPEAAESFDAYLQVLDSFVSETANQPPGAAPKPQSP